MQLNKNRSKYKGIGNILIVPTKDILPNPEQPRRAFSYQELLELAQSISENGLINPVTISFHEGQPILIAGERRLRAAKIAGIQEIPCVVKQTNRYGYALLSLIENLQRQDMNCFEVAEGIRKLIESYGLTQEDAAQKLGCSQPTIANRLRLLRLTEEERNRILEANLSERHARSLLRLDGEEMRNRVLDRIIRDKLSVVQTERVIDEIVQGKSKQKKAIPFIRDVRLFINTVNHAVDTMRRSGIKAQAEKTETERYIEYYVRIPKDTVSLSKKNYIAENQA